MMYRMRQLFKKHPFLSNLISYGAMYTASETCQQAYIIRLSPHQKKMDWTRVGNYGVVGTVFLAPVLLYWYKFLDSTIPSTTLKRIVIKVFVDQGVIAVASICIFFVGAKASPSDGGEMWSRTKQIFQKRPLLMNMASFGTMYVGAEMAQQAILQRTSPKKAMDWAIVGRYAVIGLAGIGPALFYWYRFLDAALPAVTGAVVARKVFTDQLCSSPACISMFFVVGRMWSRTKHLFQRRPLLMNMVSFGTMYVGAEVAQQSLLLRASKERKSLDWASVGRFAVVGIAGIAPVLFCWYKCLDFVLPSASRATVAKKVAADQLVAASSTLVLFFTGMSVLEGREDVFAELKAKFWSTYKLSCCFWLPAQAINFALLPPYTRVAFVGVASFVWVNVLCLVKRQEFSEEPVVEEGKGLRNLLPPEKP